MSGLLGEKLRRMRKLRKLTLDQLAVATNSSKSYIWELENKHDANPSAEKLSQIAKALGVDTDFFLDDTKSDPNEEDFDQAFFRRYRSLTRQTKEKVDRIIDILEADDE